MTRPAEDALADRVILGVRRVFYVHDSVVDTSDGRLEFALSDGVVGFEAGPDGETLVVDDVAWRDPFAASPSPENDAYVQAHGQWALVDVSHEPAWARVLGGTVIASRPITRRGKLVGMTTVIGATEVVAMVVADELHVSIESVSKSEASGA